MREASETNTALFQLNAVSKYYADGDVHALRDISLEIKPGQSVAIVGPSGCGKSTLLNILGALDLPTSGQVLYQGLPIKNADLNRLRSREFGFVFQSFYLLPNLTALENIQIPMFEGPLPFNQRVGEAQRLLELVGLGDRGQHLPNQLSNGQRQRVAIARALANRPKVILADEPTGSLDSVSGTEVIDLLLNLNRLNRTTLIMVTHDLNLAEQMDRMIRLRDGRLQSDSPCAASWGKD